MTYSKVVRKVLHDDFLRCLERARRHTTELGNFWICHMLGSEEAKALVHERLDGQYTYSDWAKIYHPDNEHVRPAILVPRQHNVYWLPGKIAWLEALVEEFAEKPDEVVTLGTLMKAEDEN